MMDRDIALQRLHNQRLVSTSFKEPDDAVRWLGAVQAQDFAAAKWAVGLRSVGITDEDIEQAFAKGTILRTHVMRPTWHFITPSDIRWLLDLTAPRVHSASVYYYRKLGLDDPIFKRSSQMLVKVLQGDRQRTREEIAAIFKQRNLPAEGLGLIYLLMQAELDKVICSGARRGKQFTYALLDECVPQTQILDHDEALAELAKRYFTSRGPATLQDFVWWSGLTTSDAQEGLEIVKPQLLHEKVEGHSYWFPASSPNAKGVSPSAYLLPNYDEYIVGYTNRSAVFDSSHASMLDARGNVLFQHTIVINGRVVGTWKRTLKKNLAIIEATLFTSLNTAETQAVTSAAEAYGKFLNLPVRLEF